jgi:hypothetical protein
VVRNGRTVSLESRDTWLKRPLAAARRRAAAAALWRALAM